MVSDKVYGLINTKKSKQTCFTILNKTPSKTNVFPSDVEKDCSSLVIGRIVQLIDCLTCKVRVLHRAHCFLLSLLFLVAT